MTFKKAAQISTEVTFYEIIEISRSPALSLNSKKTLLKE